MKLLTLVLAAIVAYATAQSNCPRSNIVFLIDESETARRNDNFVYLRQTLNRFVSDSSLQVQSTGIIGYSGTTYSYANLGTNNQFQLTQAAQRVGSTGIQPEGSYTDVGFNAIGFSSPVAGVNNVVFMIMSGEGSSARTTQAKQAADNLKARGWKIFAISVNDGFAIRNGLEASGISDYQKINSYQTMDIASIYRSKFCTAPIATTPRPLAGTICSKCLNDGGFQFDADPENCDTYYRCVVGGAPIRSNCPSGTFWNQTTGCDHIAKTKCSIAPCSGSSEGSTYHSGRCCNGYYVCKNGVNEEMYCDRDHIYDTQSRQCVRSNDAHKECARQGKFYCNHLNEGNDKCPLAEVFGDPCSFTNGGRTMRTAEGTKFDRERCVLVRAEESCANVLTDRDFSTDIVDNCNEVFLAKFEPGKETEVVSPRLGGKKINIFSQYNNVDFQNNGISYASGANNPYYYYFFFNNKQITMNSAWRMIFKLENFELGKEYYLMSNYFCPQCPETYAITVSAPSQNQRLITARLTRSSTEVYEVSGRITLQPGDETLELYVLYGVGKLSGQIRQININNPTFPIQTVDLSTKDVPKTAFNGNKCGLLLGKALNSQAFVGTIYEFGFYDRCKNINSILP